MEQELNKVQEHINKMKCHNLNAEIDLGNDYGYELCGQDTIIVTDEYDNIVAEGETADEIISILNKR